MKGRRMIRQRLTEQGVKANRLKDEAAKHRINILSPSDPTRLKWPRKGRRRISERKVKV